MPESFWLSDMQWKRLAPNTIFSELTQLSLNHD